VKLQLALDHFDSIQQAISLLVEVVDLVDIVEVGTPMIIQEGVNFAKQIMVDLISVSDIQTRSSEVDALGVDYICAHTAFDMQGTEEEIRAEVRQRIDALAPGGGYVLSTCNVIVNAPPENIVAMFDEARTYGRHDK